MLLLSHVQTILGFEVLELAPKTFESKAAYEEAIVAELRAKDVEWVVLAGYMRLVSDVLLTCLSKPYCQYSPFSFTIIPW